MTVTFFLAIIFTSISIICFAYTYYALSKSSNNLQIALWLNFSLYCITFFLLFETFVSTASLFSVTRAIRLIISVILSLLFISALNKKAKNTKEKEKPVFNSMEELIGQSGYIISEYNGGFIGTFTSINKNDVHVLVYGKDSTVFNIGDKFKITEIVGSKKIIAEKLV